MSKKLLNISSSNISLRYYFILISFKKKKKKKRTIKTRFYILEKKIVNK